MRKLIGIGVVNYNRLDGLKRTVESLRKFAPVDCKLMVSIDDSPIARECISYLDSVGMAYRYNLPRHGSIGNDNDVWHYLYNEGCEHIFMIEDDVAMLNPEAIPTLVTNIETWGLNHLQMRTGYDMPWLPKIKIESELRSKQGAELSCSRCVSELEIDKYGDWWPARTELAYVSRLCLETIGYMDTSLGPYSGPGHPDYLLRARRAGLYDKDWYISFPGVVPMFRWDCEGDRGTCTRPEIDAGDLNIPLIYGERPLYVPYN